MNSDESNFLINSEDGVFFNPVKHNKPVLIKQLETYDNNILDGTQRNNLTNPNKSNFDNENVENDEDDLEDDEEDEIEPKLTYSRLRGDMPNILKNEFITCMTSHEKFIILGTQSGKLFLLLTTGEICSSGLNSNHRTSINQISIDEKADFIASCSDFRIVINELYSNTQEPHYMATFERPVKAISIDPNYATSSGRRFVIGEADRLLLYEKNIIGRYKVFCLQQARGVIRCTSWRNNFIVWASDLCMKIYDVQERTIITHLDREKETDYRIKLDVYQCRMIWKDDRTLLVTWGSSIKMCCIKPKNHDSEMNLTNVVGSERMPKYYVELVYSFNIENHLIACGAVPFENRLLILCTNKSLLSPAIGDVDPLKEKKLIRIKMVEPKNADLFTDISDDILEPNEFLKTVQRSCDISIHHSPENFYIILCPKDLIIVRPLGEDDSIDWLLRCGKFSEAFNRVKTYRKCIRHTRESVGQLYIKNLLETSTLDSCEEAGKICFELCNTNPNLWEDQLNLFKQYRCIRVLIKYLPTGPNSQLKPALYEMILIEILNFDSANFLNLIRTLSKNLYSTSTMINHVTNKLSTKTANDQNLLEALAELHTNECRYSEALFIFLQVGNAKKVFELIWKHQLLYLLEDRIIQLLELDPEETSRLLISNKDTIPVDKIVSRLQKHPRLLCAYLDRLIYRDPSACALYHDMLFDLYAKNEPDKIVPFLRQSNYIQLEKALKVCKKQELTKAVVFILGRMGKTHEALRIITDKMDDINAAIEFCKEHGDDDLWAELMDISVNKPQLLSTLLREVGTYVTDPIGLIVRIPRGLEVPNLVPSLVKILEDYRLMVTLEEGCKRVLNSDCYNLFSKLYKMSSRAVVVKDAERFCCLCQLQSTTRAHDVMYATRGEYILFQCGHLFHKSCLQYSNSNKSTTMPSVSSSISVPTFATVMGVNNEDTTNIKAHINEEKLCIICQTKKKKSAPVIPSISSMVNIQQSSTFGSSP